VVINSNGQIIEKNTKVSFTKPAVDKVEIKDSKTYLTYTVSGSSVALTEQLLSQVNIKDTYGKDVDVNGTTVTYKNSDEARVQVVVSDIDNTSAKVTGNGTTAVAITGVTANDTFKVTLTIGGKVFTANVQVK
ncbi:MAG: hypothetical protein KH355_02710, partial [Clostridiales bacterium]|nr:hypothetical protein [Clostridiales bacterium]